MTAIHFVESDLKETSSNKVSIWEANVAQSSEEKAIDRELKEDGLAREVKKLKQCTFEIYNNVVYVSWPYHFFVFNHEDLYMRDLSYHDPNKVFYMNDYLGISKEQRIITVWSWFGDDKLTVTVPTVYKGYNAHEFHVRLHNLRSNASA